jgi:hypothetical protein
MTSVSRRLACAVAALAIVVGATGSAAHLGAADAPLPAAIGPIGPIGPIGDEEFWHLTSEFSERAGTFQSDNLLSNERDLQQVIPDLQRGTGTPGVYLGVGPEQNFTYIAALRPQMAFIIDIRRGNFDLHLMYKALFELSADRAEFVSRLFARKRPDGLTAASTASEIFEAFARVEPTDTMYSQNLRAIVRQLTKTHGFVLSSADTLRLQHIYTAISTYGPTIQYSTSQNAGRWRSTEPTYRDLMVATDRTGQARGFLASEDAFAFLKKFEADNLLIPLIGNFAGPRAIRAVADYVRHRGATVSAFYFSNVEEYLRQDGLWRDFCENVAALPLTPASAFVRAVRDGRPGAGFALTNELGSIGAAFRSCADE